ncbi:MAG: PadR family transcriptional regulator [Gemmatimonadota bacterium]|nr:PadR family transcriptional regulator [Gemmatimonadota bacterium]
MALGELEQAVLFALVRIDGESHGAAIIEGIEAGTGKRVSPGALYTVLDRLESKGYVRSRIGDSTPARGGRRRKLYQILPEGAQTLRVWYAGIRQLASGVGARLDRLAEESG